MRRALLETIRAARAPCDRTDVAIADGAMAGAMRQLRRAYEYGHHDGWLVGTGAETPDDQA